MIELVQNSQGSYNIVKTTKVTLLNQDNFEEYEEVQDTLAENLEFEDGVELLAWIQSIAILRDSDNLE